MPQSKTKIRVVIVDDEPLAREGVRLLLSKDSDFEISGEVANASKALEAVNKLHPDLLFLDVSMPGKNGFDLLKDIPSAIMPIVIFVTAHDKYAIPAFEVHALDYLLKPIIEERFAATLRRVKSYVRQKQQAHISQKLVSLLDQLQLAADRRAAGGFLERFAVRTGDVISFVPANEVDWIEAADYYAILHCSRKIHLVRQPIKELESNLDPKKFVRIHRSTIVKIDRIKEVQRLSDGGYEILLTDQTRLKLSRTYLPTLQELLGKR